MKKLAVLFALLLSVPALAQTGGGYSFYGVLRPIQLGVYDTTVHISAAQLKALINTPVTLVPAQGANTVISPIEVLVSTNHTDGSLYTDSTTPDLYASLGTNGIANGASVTDAGGLANDLVFDSSNHIGILLSPSPATPMLYSWTQSTPPTIDSITNKPLLLSLVNSAYYGSGAATLDVEVIYTIHRKQ